MLIYDHVAILADHGRVLYDAVMAGRDHDHLLRSKDHLFIVLSDVGHWTQFHFGDIGVLVQYMNIVIRWNPIDTLRFVVFSSAIHFGSLVLNLQREREG